jgi:hypothetical protein
MRWKTLIVALAVWGIWTSTASAGGDLKIGTSGAQYLRIPVGSRYSAMGGSAVAFADGVDAFFWNPAGASTLTGTDLLLSRHQYIADINVDYIAAARPIGDLGVLGVTAKILSMGDELVTTTAHPDGTGETYSSSFSVVGISYARTLTDRVAIGVNASLLYESIAQQSATGVAIDVGFRYTPGWHDLTFGGVIKNLGPKMRYDGPGFDLNTPTGTDPNSLPHGTRSESATFEIPSYVQFGGAYKALDAQKSVLNVTGTFQSNNFSQDEWRAGAEYAFDETFFVRGGYTYAKQKDYLFGPSFGAGLKFNIGSTRVNLDYAWSQSDFFSDDQYFTLQLGF